MRVVRLVFNIAYASTSLLFVVCAVALIGYAGLDLLDVVRSGGGEPHARLDRVLETIALLTIAVAALELGQTILEEEILRQAQMSAPTRVRRFLSRFMVVIVVSLSIETLVAVFQVLHRDPRLLPYASSVAFAAAALLAAWGVFVRLNRAAEELEPEAMQEAKKEDQKVS
jgi:hypothetical protein